MTADSVDGRVLVWMGIFAAGVGGLVVVADFLGYVSRGTGFVALVSGAAVQCSFGFWLRRSGTPRLAIANFAVAALSLVLLLVLVAVRALRLTV